MNEILGVSETLELLGKLKSALRGFAAREDQLASEQRQQAALAAKARDTVQYELTGKIETSQAEAEAAFQAGQELLQTRVNRFQARIARAQRTSLKFRLAQIDDAEGRHKYQVQKSMLDNERREEKEKTEATARWREFEQKVDGAQEASQQLVHRAAQAFRGFGAFSRELSPDLDWPDAASIPAQPQLLAEWATLQQQLKSDLNRFHHLLLPRLFAVLPLYLIIILLLLLGAVAVPALRHFGVQNVSYEIAGGGAAVLMILTILAHFLGRRSALPLARKISLGLANARRFHTAGLKQAEDGLKADHARIAQESAHIKEALEIEWQTAYRQAAERRAEAPRLNEQKTQRATARNEALRQAAISRLEHAKTQAVETARQAADQVHQQAEQTYVARVAAIENEFSSRWKALVTEWQTSVQPVWEALHAAKSQGESQFPSWNDPRWETWTPPTEFQNHAHFARLEVNLDKLAETTWESRRLRLPGPSSFAVPLVLTYPRQGSLLFETTTTGGDDVVRAMNNVIFRLLSTTPPGKLSLTIIDPTGLGQSFASLMHLADFEESYINSRIWTQGQQIEEKLADLSEHMEKVIQMYLRNEYPTIAEYNARAGVIAEKYHLLVIAGFPVNFSETAARRLQSIVASGARCGVYTLIHWDHRHAAPRDFVPDELRKNQVCVTAGDKGFSLTGARLAGTRLVLEEPPSAEFVTRFLRVVGQSGKNASRVEVPFPQIAPAPAEIWSEDSTSELRVPIGLAGPAKWQYFALGKGTRQHALIAGKTGSGKSTLFHILITNLALRFSPDQVEFYLVDFKKGVEFRCYGQRRLPHARVVAIESDRAFGLSVLQRVDEELRRRGDLFRQASAQDLPGYKKSPGALPMPRCLLIIDEFQEFFVEEDRVSQNAAVLLDRIVRQGRAFGIHVMLGSQTLGGAYTLARATLGQMVVRIALQCNETDAMLIMDEHNTAPRLLSRPGEGIYNDDAGSIEGNSPFQAVWITDESRDEYLAAIRARAEAAPQKYPGPMVFEGNAPADPRDNAALQAALTSPANVPAPTPRVWLGAPNSIKGPTEAVFPRRGGSNLLIVGQREEASLALLSIALISLVAQHPPGTARFVFLDNRPAAEWDRVFLDRVFAAFPRHQIERPRHNELAGVLNELAEETKRPDRATEAPPIFLFVYRLEDFKSLRQEDDFSFGGGEAGPSPASLFQQIVAEGPARGVHVIVNSDTGASVIRSLGRKLLAEMAMRVLFQMSANDSANLVESPEASTLGLHRALFYHDREGGIEIFRPYALPSTAWVDEIATRFQ